VLAEFKIQSDRVKVKDARDREILKIKRKNDGWELEDAEGTRLFRARLREGTWFLSNGAEVSVARLVPTTEGVRILDSQDRQVALARRGVGQVEFQGADGQAKAVVRGVSEPLAAAWFLVSDVEPLAQVALVVYSLEVP